VNWGGFRPAVNSLQQNRLRWRGLTTQNFNRVRKSCRSVNLFGEEGSVQGRGAEFIRKERVGPWDWRNAQKGRNDCKRKR